MGSCDEKQDTHTDCTCSALAGTLCTAHIVQHQVTNTSLLLRFPKKCAQYCANLAEATETFSFCQLVV